MQISCIRLSDRFHATRLSAGAHVPPGQFVEAGRHEELLLRRGTYAELVRAQIEKTGRLE